MDATAALRDNCGLRFAWIVTGLLAVAATVAFALGSDGWDRSIRQPTADAAYYYAYLPTVALDRDLDFDNEYRVTKNWYHLGKTPTGRTANVFGIGPAVFEMPAFVVGHGLAVATGERRDGFSSYETTLVLWMSIPASLGALLIAYRLARRRVGAVAAYTGALLAAAGPLLYYAVRQPGYAHPFAALFAALLVERWDASYDGAPRTLRTWIVLGLAGGAAVLARPQLVLWCLLLPAAAVDDLRRRGTTRIATLLLRWTAGAAAALVVVAPQLIAWKALYGAWYVVPQGAGFMRWDAPAWSETLFSSRNGLFPWTPLYAPMLVGVLVLARDGMRLPLALLLGLFGQALANGAAWDWWAGGSFGGRRFDSAYVVFALGAAVLVQLAIRPRRLAARIAAGAALCAAILVALATVELAMKTSVVSARITGGESPAHVWRAQVGGVRGWLAGALASASAAPARAAFAWRYGVDGDVYDRLVGVHVLGETYPGLNSFPDKLADVVVPRGINADGLADGAMTGDTARVLFGVNRRGRVVAHVPVESTGDVTATWNGVTATRRGAGTLELDVEPSRGTNVIELAGPPGTRVGAITLTAR